VKAGAQVTTILVTAVVPIVPEPLTIVQTVLVGCVCTTSGFTNAGGPDGNGVVFKFD
jgi:hypothetical protein